MKFKTPYADFLPPLEEEELDALKSSLKEHGQLSPIIVDEDGNILDGHSRAKLLGESVKHTVLRGLTEAERKAFVTKTNKARRNLSAEQKAKLLEKQKEIAFELKKEGKRQREIAVALAVSQKTISNWIVENVSNRSVGNAHTPELDSRRKVPRREEKTIVARLDKGETQKEIANELGVERSTIALVKKRSKKPRFKEYAGLLSKNVMRFKKLWRMCSPEEKEQIKSIIEQDKS